MYANAFVPRVGISIERSPSIPIFVRTGLYTVTVFICVALPAVTVIVTVASAVPALTVRTPSAMLTPPAPDTLHAFAVEAGISRPFASNSIAVYVFVAFPFAGTAK